MGFGEAKKNGGVPLTIPRPGSERVLNDVKFRVCFYKEKGRLAAAPPLDPISLTWWRG